MRLVAVAVHPIAATAARAGHPEGVAEPKRHHYQLLATILTVFQSVFLVWASMPAPLAPVTVASDCGV